MEKIKLFEDFILETSSRKLEDINQSLKKITKGLGQYSHLEFALLYILYANASESTIDNLSRKSKQKRGTSYAQRDDILTDKELLGKLDMDKAIETYKEMLKYNGNKVKKYGYDREVYEEESESEKKAITAIEEILDHYKKTKNKDKVDFASFAEYVLKVERVIRKTDKDSEKSRKNTIDAIIRSGVDMKSIYEKMDKYGKEEKNLVILTEFVLKVGDTFKGNDRFNDVSCPIMKSTFWNDEDNLYMLETNLHFENGNCVISLGYVGQRYQPTLLFGDDDPQVIDSENIKKLRKNIEGFEKLFGKEKFEEILTKIFKIYEECGAKVQFDYKELKKLIDNE